MRELNETEALKCKKSIADFIEELDLELASFYNSHTEDSAHFKITFNLIKDFSLHYDRVKQKIYLDLTLEFILNENGTEYVEEVVSEKQDLNMDAIINDVESATTTLLEEYENEIAVDNYDFGIDVDYYFDKGKNGGKGEE